MSSDEKDDVSRWVSYSEASKELGLSERTIRRYAAQGKIRVRKRAGRAEVDMASAPDTEDGAELVEAATSMVKESAAAHKELFTLYQNGIERIFEHFATEAERAREHNRKLEDQLRKVHQKLQEAESTDFERQLAVTELEGQEHRRERALEMGLSYLGTKLGLTPKALAEAAVAAATSSPEAGAEGS